MIFFRRLVGRLPAEGEVGATVEKKRCNEIEPGSKFVRVHTFNPKDSNTVVTNYYQVRCKLSLSSNTGQVKEVKNKPWRLFPKTPFGGISWVGSVCGENSSGQEMIFFLAGTPRQGKMLTFFLPTNPGKKL